MWEEELSNAVIGIGLVVHFGTLEFGKGPVVCLIGQDDTVDYFSEISGETTTTVAELYNAIEYELRIGGASGAKAYIDDPANQIGLATGDKPVEVLQAAFKDWQEKVG